MSKIGSVLFSIWFYAVTLSLSVLGQFAVMVAPLSLPAFARFWSRAVLFALPVCGVRYEVTGREHLTQDRAMLIASMHQSAFDTLLWFDLVTRCRYVVKMELIKLPLFGRLARFSGQIGVDRNAGAAAMRTLLRDGGAALAEGNHLVIFPEGTRVETGGVGTLQPGIAALARKANIAVIPVVTDSGWCWRKGAFGKRPGTIHVVIHPPIEPGLSREALMERLQSIYETGLADLRTTHRAVDNSVH